MLPTAHVEFTWAALNLIQRRTGAMTEADYRWMAAAALAPDLLDKPLALTVYRESSAALFWGHNLWFHGAVWLIALAAFAVRGPITRAFPYLLAFSGHLLADRMWGFQESLFYPLGGGRWHTWVHVGDAGAMLNAYLTIITETPLLIVFELAGLALLLWLVADRELWRRPNFGRFLRTGRVQEETAGVACVPESDGRSSLRRRHGSAHAEQPRG